MYWQKMKNMIGQKFRRIFYHFVGGDRITLKMKKNHLKHVFKQFLTIRWKWNRWMYIREKEGRERGREEWDDKKINISTSRHNE